MLSSFGGFKMTKVGRVCLLASYERGVIFWSFCGYYQFLVGYVGHCLGTYMVLEFF